jgi:hypothetical protein
MATFRWGSNPSSGNGASAFAFTVTSVGVSIAAAAGAATLAFLASGVGDSVSASPSAGTSSLSFSAIGASAALASAVGASNLAFSAIGFSGGIVIPTVILNGVSDYRAFTTAPSGATTTLSGVHGCTWQSDGSAMTILEISNGTGVVLSLRRTATNTIELKGFQSDAATSVFSNVTSAIPASTGRVLIEWDCSGTTAHLYVITVADGTLVTGTNTPGTAGSLDITGTWYFGRTAAGTEYEDAVVNYDAVSTDYPDLSNSDHREEFYDSTAHELRDPGIDGSNPFTGVPLVSFQHNAANFLFNAGSGGTPIGSNSGDATLLGAWAANYVPASILTAAYIGGHEDDTDATAFTWTAAGIGTASADRFILVRACVEMSTASAVNTDFTLTIGGNAATRAKDRMHAGGTGGGQGTYTGYWILKVTSGTTADVVLDCNGKTAQHIHLALYTIKGNASLSTTPYSSASADSGAMSFDVPTGGVAFVGGIAAPFSTVALSDATGWTTDSAAHMEFAGYQFAAHYSTVGTGHSVTLTNVNTEVVAVFGG